MKNNLGLNEDERQNPIDNNYRDCYNSKFKTWYEEQMELMRKEWNERFTKMLDEFDEKYRKHHCGIDPPATIKLSDGEVKVGDIWYNITDDFEILMNVNAGIPTNITERCFKFNENAHNWINQNKPKYSLNQMNKCWNESYCSTISPYGRYRHPSFESYIKTVK